MIDEIDYQESETKLLVYDDIKKVQKRYKYEVKLFKKILINWNASKNLIITKIDNVINNWPVTDKQLVAKFFCCHWNLIPYDLRMYVIATLPEVTMTEKEPAVLDIYHNSISSIEDKINILLTAQDKPFAKSFIKDFFLKHQDLIPEELNPFVQEAKKLAALKIQYQTLVLEKKLLEK